MKIVRVICTAAMFLFVLGCGDNAKNTSTYSTDLINNPNTADANAKAIKMPKITFNKKLHDFGNYLEVRAFPIVSNLLIPEMPICLFRIAMQHAVAQ